MLIETQMDEQKLERMQWRSQNAEKVTHINGRLLYPALILYNYVPFRISTSLKGKNLFQEGASIIFPLRAVPCGMGNHFYHIS